MIKNGRYSEMLKAAQRDRQER